MKKIYTLLLWLLITSSTIYSQGTWTQRANYPSPYGRQYAAGFSIGGKGYFYGGTFVSEMTEVYEFDTLTNSWSQISNFIMAARSQVMNFVIGDTAYFVGGQNQSMIYSETWAWDPSSNSWTQKANFGGGQRYAGIGFTANGKGYVGTGSSNSNFYNDIWEYDPIGNTWIQKANLPANVRTKAMGFAIGNKGYVGTGWDYFTYTALKDFWEFDPIGNTWTQKADFTSILRWSPVGFGIGNKGYAGTGYDWLNNLALDDFWEYDPSTNIWTQKPDVGYQNQNRLAASGFSIGNKGYIGLGVLGQYWYLSFFEYSTVTLPPVAAMSVGQTTFCGTGQLTGFADLSSNIPTSWSWSFPGGTPSSSTNQNQAVNYSTSGSYPVTLIVSNAGGSDTLLDTVTIVINPLPSAFAGNDTSVCNQSYIQLNASGGTIYSWSPGVGLSNYLIPNPLASPSNNTTYTVYVTDTNGCTNSDNLFISVLPTPSFSVYGNYPICVGGTANLTVSGSGNYTYNWQPGNYTGTAFSVSPNITTDYTVTATASNGCTSVIVTQVTVYNCTSIKNHDSLNISISPNPTSRFITIHGELDDSQMTVITDIFGNIVFTISSSIKDIDMWGVSSGVYFIHLRSRSGYLIQKIIRL